MVVVRTCVLCVVLSYVRVCFGEYWEGLVRRGD